MSPIETQSRLLGKPFGIFGIGLAELPFLQELRALLPVGIIEGAIYLNGLRVGVTSGAG